MQRQRCVRDFGYITTPATTMTTSAGSSTSSAGSKGPGKDVKNKFEKARGRVLTRWVSEGDPARNLSQAMDEAADEELIPAEAPPTSPLVGGAPPQTNADDFWTRMDGMLDKNMTNMGNHFGVALNQLENRLGTEIQRERSA